MKLVVPQPTGACSGATNALRFLHLVRSEYPTRRIFVNHEPVHHVSSQEILAANNILTFGDVGSHQFEPGDIVVGSAHGTPIQEIDDLSRRGVLFLDATCPLVLANYAWLTSPRPLIVLYVGKPGHREYEATVSRLSSRLHFSIDLHAQSVSSVCETIRESGLQGQIVVVRQTTVPENDPHFMRIQGVLRAGLPEFKFLPNRGECFATQNRQEAMLAAIEAFSPTMVIVLTAERSSNGMALVSSAKGRIQKVIHGETPSELQLATNGDLQLTETAILVAAASVPWKVIDLTISHIAETMSRYGLHVDVERPWMIPRETEPVLKMPELS